MTHAWAPRNDEQRRWGSRFAGIDRVTGLPDRAAFEIELAEALSRTAGAQLTLVLVHVSGAATIRSRYGSAEADALLVRAARAIARRKRSGDFAARAGDDDFALVLADTSLEEGLMVARRIAHDAERANGRLGPDEVPLFLAFGAAECAGCEPGALVEAARPRGGATVAPVGAAPAEPPTSEGPSVA
jgi:diguanylate cyclase (GGDEF)-like protein